ncbi:MAG: hypothetical protein ACPLZY_05000, partial [Candidatus Norongarragalinales archaeon]
MEFEPLVEEFLSVQRKETTRRAYTNAFRRFQEFYGKPIGDFLKHVEEDMRNSRFSQSRVARTTLAGFVKCLQSAGKENKTIRAYVGAIQGLAKYYDIPIGGRYINLPPSTVANKKHPWTIDEIGNFISSFKHPTYKSIAACIVQSGLSLSDLLELTYGDIREEFEKGVTPLCLDLTRKKTGVRFVTFVGSWSVALLKDHFAGKRLRDDTPIYDVCDRAVHA